MNFTDPELIVIKSIVFSSSDSSDSSNEEDEYLPKKSRRFWVRPYYKQRDDSGAHKTVVQSLQRVCDAGLFKQYMRMSFSNFEELLRLVGPTITKQTVLREPISPSSRLSITLRYLATGESQQSLSLAYKCSRISVRRIIVETTRAISNALKLKVFPKLNKETFRSIGNGFSKNWNFPNCIGAIDGKHITIQAPANSGTLFFNYKKSFSIVLLAICDHKYNFIMCDIGAAGRQSDGGIFRNSEFGKRFYNNSLAIPENCDVAEDFKDVPHLFVADDAFALHINMLKPYSKKNLTRQQRIFNYRLSRARRIVENSFGILSSKWRIFKSTINAKVDLVEDIIHCCVCLHNWLLQTDTSGNYFTQTLVDHEENGVLLPGTWREEQNNFLPLETTGTSGNSITAAKNLRDRFSNYFVGSGAVEWQNTIL